MSFPSYPEYKNSGVVWLGEFPKHWSLTALKHMATLNPRKSDFNGDKEQNCSFVPMEKLKTGKITLDEERVIGDVIDGYTYFESGDILQAKVTPCFENKNVAIAKSLINGVGFGSSEIDVLRPTSETDSVYLFYRIQEDGYMAICTASMIGAGGLKRVPSDVKNNFKVATPPFGEQTQIASFLDHETAKIDTLIHEQKRLIELLKEKRQAVISHAVTKGLDPDVPMKDSGVESFGEVPAHWDIARYKNVAKIVQGLAFSSKDYVEDSNVISVRMGNIRQNGIVDLNHNSKFLPQNFSEKFSNYALFEGDLIIAMTDMSPTLDFLAVPATITGTLKTNTYLLNQRVGKLVVMPNINQNFLKLCLLSLPLRSQLKGKGLGTVQANMSNDDLYTAFVGLPPLLEQSVIVKSIQMASSKIDILTKSANETISLLRERRSSLISAAVTGKIDVRNWQPPTDKSAFNEEVHPAGMETTA